MKINMENRIVITPNSGPWASRLFMIAGAFMLINTALLWIRFLSDLQLSVLWPAIPGTIGFASGIIGLVILYPRASANAPLLARGGAAFALLAAASLGAAATWIFALSAFGGGVPDPVPQGVLALIGVFIVSMVLAFLGNAVAFLRKTGQRKIGYLLMVPISMWVLMLAISISMGPGVGLSLDFYTNAMIAASFIGLAIVLQEKVHS